MKTLFIHAGFPKTGSSFLQVFFAQNAAFLRETFGLHYALPDHKSSQLALEGGIASGNGQVFLGQLGKGEPVRDFLASYLDPACNHSLISTESWGPYVTQEQNIAIRTEAERLGYRVRCIVFRRDPFDQAISSYLQLVKRDALAIPFEAYCKRFINHHARFETQLQDVYDLEVLDYDACRDNLAAALFRQMGFDTSHLPEAETGIVNRSLSREECRFLVQLNAQHRDSVLSGFISDQLVSEHPFSGTPLRHTRETFANLCSALGLDPAEEAGRRGFVPDDTPVDPDATTEAALRIQGYLCGMVQLYRGNPNAKKDSPSNALVRSRDRARLLKAKNLCLLAAGSGAKARHRQLQKACARLGCQEEYEALIRFLVRKRYPGIAEEVRLQGIASGHEGLADIGPFKPQGRAAGLKTLFKA